MRIAESDWKIFKRVWTLALERFSQRVLDACQRIGCDESLSAHERYGKLYRLLQDRDREKMSRIFDDLRRSTAVPCLMLMHHHGIVTDEEMLEFSPEVQRATNLD